MDDTKRVELNTPVPVYYLYWTAIPAPDGAVGFRGDLYGRDAQLIDVLSRTRDDERAPGSAIEPIAESTRVSDTLLPATIDPSADTERGSELSPLDERGSELPALDESGGDIAPMPDAGPATQNRDVSEAVRSANQRTRFTYYPGRDEGTRSSESTEPPRTRPSEDTRYGRPSRLTQPEPAFPRLNRLFEGNRSRAPYTGRGRP